MKVAELDDVQLDYWVAQAEEFEVKPYMGGLFLANGQWYRPSASWSQAGPIIGRERIAVWAGKGKWCATHPATMGTAYDGQSDYIDVSDYDSSCGSRPLIAAMRAYVASKYGDEVPDEMK
jgi:hypothetical protein